MNKRDLKTLLLIFILILSGGGPLAATGEAIGGEISLKDAAKIHPGSPLIKRTRTLAPGESEQINRLYGAPIAKAGGRIAYYEARRRIYPVNDGRSVFLKGNIFLIREAGESGPLKVSVSVLNGRVKRLLVEGDPAVSEEFLSQFIGRSLEHSFEIAKEPSDLLTVPAKVRPMAKAPQDSRAVADAVKRALALGTVLESY